jgi:S-adenosylmethionine uptake transporter
MWGWVIWGEIPASAVSVGIVLIMGSGLFVFLREMRKNRKAALAHRVHRRY